MKRFTTLFMIIVLSVNYCAAQDILVKKDGTTIMSKVMEVGTTEIKYKKHSNLNGPTYTILKSEILSINYENGTKDSFEKEHVSANKQPSVVVVQNGNDKVSYMQQQEVENYYKKARSQKIWSWVLIGLGSANLVGDAAALIANGGDKGPLIDSPFLWSSIGVGVACVGTGIYLNMSSRSYLEIARRMSQASIPIQEFKIGNSTMTPMLSLYNDRLTHDTSLGLGCNIRF